MYCSVLYCAVLCCTVLYCTVLYCTVLYCTVLYCTVLYCTDRMKGMALTCLAHWLANRPNSVGMIGQSSRLGETLPFYNYNHMLIYNLGLLQLTRWRHGFGKPLSSSCPDSCSSSDRIRIRRMRMIHRSFSEVTIPDINRILRPLDIRFSKKAVTSKQPYINYFFLAQGTEGPN